MGTAQSHPATRVRSDSSLPAEPPRALARVSILTPLGFGLALVVLVALGAFTYASIADLMAATAAVTRSLQTIERLQALKAAAREAESSAIGFVTTGQPGYRESFEAAHGELVRVGRDLGAFVDTASGRDRLQRITALTGELGTALGSVVAMRDGSPPVEGRASAHPRAELLSDRVIGRIDEIQREERHALAGRQETAAARARTAESRVLVATALGFTTIVFAALMVRRDILARRAATDRLEHLNVTLSEAAAEAQQRREEIARLARLSHFLQGCHSTEEACHIIENSAPALFGAPGALYLADAGTLDRTAAWADGHELQQSFAREACWGMRRGNAHETNSSGAAPPCRHLGAGRGATCVPLVADGDSFGLVVLLATGDTRPGSDARGTLIAAVEQISAGLANLRLRESLRMQSLRDPLTGLYNRRFLHDALSRECHDARRHPDRPVALMLLDVDHFKRVNDTAGHAAGDALLQALSELLGRTFRGGDIACRFGGEEFAVLLAETPLEVAIRRAEALRLTIHGLHARHGTIMLEGLTVSIGVTAGAGAGLTPEQMLQEADTALYEAKARGRDCCVAYSPAPALPFDVAPQVPIS
jgi:diguanylate cyclase (GGDEF)-like protein